MQYTDNYSLRKPQMAETASVSDINYNTDKIDGIMADDRQISLAMYVSGNTYNTGDIVGYENPSTHRIRAYRCLVDNVTGVWDSTKWTVTTLAAEILIAKASGGTEVIANPSGTPTGTLNTVEIDDAVYAVGGDSANQNIADAFSELQTYAVGDYCIYESILYKCTTAITTAGAWDSSKWEPCVVTDEMGSGGGVTYNELTQLEYDALTPAEKKNGEMYFITDTNGDGDVFQPIIYSETEREIGVWTDGKPLYQKTIDFGALPNNTTKTVAHNISNLERIVEIKGAASYPTAGANIAIPYVVNQTTTIGLQTQMNINDTNITITTKDNISMYSGYVTLQYTKTTDSAGSGTWTPQGVPAVHYSTDEQIVGTVLGVTLYGKLVTTGGSVPSGATLVLRTALSNGYDIIQYTKSS